MRTSEIKQVVKQYAEKLREEKFSFQSIYLFGSFAKNAPNKWSDIDVAIVSDKLKKNHEKYNSMLWLLGRDVDLRIEPHGFTNKEFENLNDPMVYEIRTTGIRIV